MCSSDLVSISGNLTVTGNTSYINVSSYLVNDPLIYLASNNYTSDLVDIGFAANYNDGSYKHAGFFRDATDGNWKVYDSYTPEPDANIFIDTSHASFRLANIQANVFVGDVSGNIISSGNSYSIGYREVPQKTASANYTFVNDDRSKHVYYTGSTATITVPTDDVTTGGAFPIGALLTVIHNGSANITIGGSPTIYLAGNTTATGNRTLTVRGMASLIKVASNTWFISGAGLV